VNKVTGYPRFRRLTFFLGKGQGKTFLAAGLALDTLARGVLGEKVYSAATTRDQAGLSFQTARMMLKLRPDVRDHFGLVVEQHQIVRPESGSHFKAISSEAGSAEGKIPAFILEDEIHAHKTRDLHDNLRSMAAKVPYSRQVVISTAGFDMSPKAIGYEVFCYARDILLGAVTDDSQFALIVDADRELDPWAPATWRMANPNMGISIDEVEVANEANEARQVPSKQPSFFTKRLNWWVQSASSWMDLAAWDKCFDPAMRIDDFAGGSGHIGGDLGSTLDLTAKVPVFARPAEDGRLHYYVFCKAYLAEESKTLRDGNDTLRVWADQGHLMLTPGPAMEIGIVLDDLVADIEAFPGSEVCLDPWGAIALVQGLNGAGYEAQVVQIRQGAKTQSPAMKEVEAAVLTGRLHHDGNPVLRWCVGNLIARADRNGNVAPDRESDGKKIDAGVALINAMVRAMLGSDSAYAGGTGLREV
jgi:phage terminase large subunit-like protein